MKKLLLAALAAFLLNTGCKEENIPLIVTKSVDSSYTVSPVPATNPHNVLIEEFTGQSCDNCPAARDQLESIVASYPKGNVNVVSLYIFGIDQTIPATSQGSKNDLRDPVATDISNSAIFNGVTRLPVAGVDRLLIGGTTQLGSGSWSGIVATEVNVIDSLNLLVQSSFDTTTKTGTITVWVTYTKQVSTPQNISVVVVEDSITDVQEYPAFNPTYPSGYDTAYIFTYVFRGMVSSEPFGDPVLATMTTKKPGLVYRRTYTYTPKTLAAPNQPINPKHCRVIAFVNTNNGSDYHVVQSMQTPLAP